MLDPQKASRWQRCFKKLLQGPAQAGNGEGPHGHDKANYPSTRVWSNGCFTFHAVLLEMKGHEEGRHL
jgi:hypothetical protein